MDEASGIDRLHESNPGPADLTGAPKWTQAFAHYIIDPADAVDDHGYYRKPLHAALLAVAKADLSHYRLLTRLRESWDAELTGIRCGIRPEHAPGAMLSALRNLQRLYQVRAR